MLHQPHWSYREKKRKKKNRFRGGVPSSGRAGTAIFHVIGQLKWYLGIYCCLLWGRETRARNVCRPLVLIWLWKLCYVTLRRLCVVKQVCFVASWTPLAVWMWFSERWKAVMGLRGLLRHRNGEHWWPIRSCKTGWITMSGLLFPKSIPALEHFLFFVIHDTTIPCVVSYLLRI